MRVPNKRTPDRNANPSRSPIFVVVEGGCVEKVYLDSTAEVIIVDRDVGDSAKLADVTSAEVGNFTELRADPIFKAVKHLVRPSND